MNEQQTAELLKYLTQAIEFSKEQAPLLAEEIVNWHFWSCLGSCIGLGTIAIVLFSLAVVLFKKINIPKDSDSPYWGPVIALTVSSIILTIFAIKSLGEATQAIIAPRLVILEKLTEQQNKD